MFLVLFSCNERDQSAKGCESVSASPFEMTLATSLDPARDLQRLNTLIMNNLDGFKQILEPDGIYSKELKTNDDIIKLRQTIQSITDTAISLDNIHRKYKTIVERHTSYGSRQAPIGDDNYYLTRGGFANQNAITNNQHHHTLPLDKSIPF